MSDVPEYRLYTSAQITAASCLGSPVAGGYLLYRNARNLGRPRPFTPTLVGLAITVSFFLAAFLLSDYVQVGVSLPILAFVLLRQTTVVRNYEALMDHCVARGRSASGWSAAGVAFTSFLLLFTVFLAACYATVVYRDGTQYAASPGEEICYRKGATEADARAVAEGLGKLKYFTGQGQATVYLEKTERGYRLGLICQEGAWNNPDQLKIARQIGDFVSKNSLHDAPVEVQMLGKDDRVRKTL